MKNTIYDVAKAAGVTISTVSLALRDSLKVRPKTKLRIRAAAKKLNYRPSAVARALSLQKTNTLGLIITDIKCSYYPEIIEGVENVASKYNYNLILGKSGFNAGKEEKCVNLLRASRVDGMIIAPIPGDKSLKYIRELKAEGFPFVLIEYCPGKIRANYVVVDLLSGAYQAVKHLIKSGHERIGFINVPFVSPGRLAGYKKALAEHDLNFDKRLVKASQVLTPGGGYEVMKEFLTMKNRPTAVFTINDTLAMGALRAIHEFGLKAPEDVAVVGFDDIEEAAFLDTPLTTVAQPKRELGELAAEMLIKQIEKRGTEPQQIVLQPKLIIRESSGGVRPGESITRRQSANV